MPPITHLAVSTRESIRLENTNYEYTLAAYASGDAARWRETCGVTRCAIAEAVGVHATTVGRWESGKRRPTRVHAQVLAGLLRAMQHLAER